MAEGTGGTCSEILDPGDLPSIIPDLISSSLDALMIEVDGGAQNPIDNADIDPDLPHPGAVSVSYDTTVAGLDPGDHTICVSAEGHDPAGSDSAEQCETIHLFQITLAPEAEINERLERIFPDYASLRRYLVDYGFVEREKGVYWRTELKHDA